MRILCVNCGSSSLKLDLVDASGESSQLQRVASVRVDRSGDEATLSFSVSGKKTQAHETIQNYDEAMQRGLALLDQADLITTVDAVGHRVVHGGPNLRSPTLLDEAVTRAIQAVGRLAPLHNEAALMAIGTARHWLGDAVPMVATFDTAFFADLPEVASTYAIPRDLSQKHAIRRYGFHGLAHRSMVQRFRELRPELERPRLLTLQLGSGCSITASVDGRPIDTSMGFTPLEGLIMGTRSGDLDPSIPLYLAEKQNLSLAEVAVLLNRASGLLGLSGRSPDMRDLLAAAANGDHQSRFAVEAFCYRARKYVGAYLAALGGADGIVFGGAIGENSAEIRKGICSGMEWAGLSLDPTKNQTASGAEARIDDSSNIEVWVVPADEASVVARDTYERLTQAL